MILIRMAGVIALLGYFVLLLLVSRNLGRKEVRSFAVLLLVMFIWQAGATGVSFTSDPDVARFCYAVVIGIGGSVGLFYAQFTRDFLHVRTHGWIMSVGYFLAFGFALWTLLGGPYVITDIYESPESGLLIPNFGIIFYIWAVITYSYFGYGAGLLIIQHRRAVSSSVRSRIKYVLLGLPFVFLGSAANLVPTLKAYPVDMVGNAINAFLIAYAIFRYQLLDISVVIRKGLLYSVLTAIITAVYYFAMFLTLNLLHLVTGYQILLLSLAMAVLTAFTVEPLRDRMQAWLDKRFFREKYDAGQMLQRLSHTVASVLQLNKLTDMILDDVITTMHISGGAFFIKEEKGGEYRLRASKGNDPVPANLSIFRPDSPVISWLSGHQSSLSSRVLETDPSFIGLWAREREDLKRLKAELFVPLLAAGKLIGVLALGPKLSETPFASEEQRALDTLANQTAVAIENARLFSETVAEKERTATIVEQAFAGIILLDADLKIVSLNPAAAAIIGREQQQVIGAPLGEVLGRGILDERGSMRRAIATRERVTPREAVLVAGDRRLDVLLGVTPLRDGYLLSLADITQLKEVDRLKTDIVANVSHEFRTPLAIIKAYTELLMDDDQRGVSTNDQEYLAIIDAETNRLAVMVGQLLDLARLEADRGVIAKTPVVMSEIVNDVVSSLQHEADARAIAVDVCVPRDLPAVPANKELLTTLVRNLLDNAIKFSRKGGKVDVVALREPGSLVLQVVDQGIGISDEDLPLLFEKFYRGSTAKEAGIRGTGLGLVLTKQAVEAHGGSIRVESRRGYGTRFTVTLPLNNGTEPASLDNRSGAKTPLEEPQPSAS